MKYTIDKTIHRLLLAFAGTAMLIGITGAGAADKWQERVLLDPPQSQLDAESRGRIMIYDGMTDAQIEQAMDTHFERIESMMFVGTVRTDEQGEVVRDTQTGVVLVEDDGC